MKPGNSNQNLGRNADELADYINVQKDEDEEVNIEDPIVSLPINDIESRGVIINCKNCMGGRISLPPKDNKYSSMTLPNVIRMWYCDDKPKKRASLQDVEASRFNRIKIVQAKANEHQEINLPCGESCTRFTASTEINQNMMNCKRHIIVLYHAIKPYFRIFVASLH